MPYNDTFSYPAADPVVIGGLVFSVPVYPEHAPLRFRREELGLSQSQVASLAGITLRQYQRFESGERSLSSSSMRIGLAICRTLQLDPYRFSCTPASD